MSSEMPEATEPAVENSDAPAFSLATILGEDHENLEHPDFKDKPGGGWDEEEREEVAAEGFCVECEGACRRLDFSADLVFDESE